MRKSMTRETLIVFMTSHSYDVAAIEQYIADTQRSVTAHPIGPIEQVRYWPNSDRYTVLMRTEETGS